jgi:hypothetical protein
MALLIVVMLVPALAMDPFGLNSRIGLTTPVSAQDGTGWSGKWRGTIEDNDHNQGAVLGVMTLTQSGNQVTGGYSALGGRDVKGTVDGNKFTGTWSASNTLHVEMTLAPDGQSMTARYQFSGDKDWRSCSFTRIGAGAGTGTGTTTGTATTAGTGWSGSWASGYWGNGTITQNGDQVRGNFSRDRYHFSGTVSGNKLTGASYATDIVLYQEIQLTLASDGQSIDYRSNSVIDTGKWTRTGSGSGTGTATGTGSGTGAALVAESRTADPGSIVQVPIRLDNAGNIGSMNFMLTYNTQVLKVNKVDGGSLVSGALFTPNFKTPPQVRFGLASSDGIKGSGTVAYIEFQVIGAAGSSSALTLSEVDTTDTSGKAVTVTTQNGAVTVASETGPGGKFPGDYNGDGKVTELDALAALKMSVKLLEQDLNLDIDKNGKVTAEDARLILKMAVGK